MSFPISIEICATRRNTGRAFGRPIYLQYAHNADPDGNVKTDSFQFSLDCSMAILGWLMFGDGVLDEVTANILSMDAYPRAISVWVIIFIAIIPLSKVPLRCVKISIRVRVAANDDVVHGLWWPRLKSSAEWVLDPSSLRTSQELLERDFGKLSARQSASSISLSSSFWPLFSLTLTG